jgi:hypothetical protein
MPEKQYKTAVYSKEEIVRLTKTFAYAKILATTSSIRNHRHLFTHPWVTTSVSVAPGWRDATELRQWLNQEVDSARQRLMAAAKKPKGPEEFAKAIDSMRVAMKNFFSTYATMNAEAAKISADASNVLGFCARSAALAYASANIALAWIGLLSTPATIGLNFAAKRFMLYTTEEVTGKFILKKLTVGLGAAFGTKLAENWQEAMSADFAMLQATNNAPGLIDDGWTVFFQALNQSTLGKLGETYVQQVGQISQKTSDIWATTGVVDNPLLEQRIAERNQLVQSAQNTRQQINNYRPQGQGLGMGVAKASMKFAAWGLTINSTWDSLKTLNKHWHYQY